MRLINVENLKLETFIGGHIPPYAILSHRWGNDNEEVSFKDMTRGTANKVGMTKVKGCCRQAKKDNLKYAWIDTCCIDKESSKELDEAINSMFQWYRRAAICYTYMADVPHEQDIWESTSRFSTSSWFTRGWTLQELLAPAEIHFFDETWSLIGTKEELASEIEDITGISRKFLLGWVDFHQASVAQRMSWASKRTTKRDEDIAYCLLGIFNVTMPMIYGEGRKAFERLQLKIMEQTTDDSILAWGVKVQGMEFESQTGPREDNTSAGIFATSPMDFAKCGRIVPKALDPTCITTFAVSGGYIRTSLKLQSTKSGVAYGQLNCGLENTTEGNIAIPLRCTTPSFSTVREYIRPIGYGPILLSGVRGDCYEVHEVRIRVDRQARPAEMTGKPIWLHIDGHQKLKLHLAEVWPPLEWDRGRALVMNLHDSNQTVRQRYLARFTTKAKKRRDIIVVLDLNLHAQYSRATCFAIAAPEKPDLAKIAGGLEYMQSQHLRDNVIYNGNDIIEVSVQSEDISQGSIFLLRLARNIWGPVPNADMSQRIFKAIEMDMLISSLREGDYIEETIDNAIEEQTAAISELISLKGELDKVVEKERQLAVERGGIEAKIKLMEVKMSEYDTIISEKKDRLVELEEKSGKNILNIEKIDGVKGPISWAETMIQSQLDKQKAVQNTDTPVSTGPSNVRTTSLVNGQQSMGGFIPLLWAAANGKNAILQLLIGKGADLEVRNPDNSYTALMYAAVYGRVSAVKYLLDSGAMLEAQDKYTYTPLALAASVGHEAIASLLLEKGADIEARTSDGSTPLSIAARKGKDGVVKVLLEKGANVEAENQAGDSPLLRACNYGHMDVIQKLIDAGADIHTKTYDGSTPLSAAARKGREGLVKLLLEKGADIDVKDHNGDTPLSRACLYDHMGIVKMLIDQGATVGGRNKQGNTPLKLAEQNAKTLYIITLYIHTHDLLTMTCTRSQKRKAEESEPQDHAPTSTGRPTKIVLVNGVRGGKRPKVARDDDDRLAVPAPPAPPATVYRHSKLEKIIIRNKSSTNHSMYPMVIPVVFRGVQAQEPDEKPIPFNFRCVIRSKCPDPEQGIPPTQQPAPGAVEKKRIAPKLVKAGEGEKKRLDSPSLYTIGWIVALAIEQAAARALLDEEHSEPNNFHPSLSDTNNYIWGSVGQHNIVIASLPAGVYGTTSAATTASDLVHSLPQIRFGLLVGIGGGIARPNDDQDIRLGDVVVGQPHGVTGGVVQYDFGKAKANGVWERTGSIDKPPAVLLKALANLQAEHEIRPSKIPRILTAMLKANPGMKRPGSNFTYQGSENDRLFPSDYEHFDGKTCTKCDVSRRIDREERGTTEPVIHYGVIASGNTLIKDARLRDGLAESIGHQCLCVEMEAVGLVDKFPCLVIRGICDYADSHKNDQWQRYAASTAAAFAVELLGFVPARQLKESPRVLEILESLEGKMDSMNYQMQQTGLTSTLDQLPFVAEALFNSYAEEHSPVCLPETRVELLAQIDKWAERSESKTIFWLNGMAGTGKSTISRTIAQRQLERGCLGANFFFKRGEGARGNMSKLIPTLARQIATHIPDALDECEDSFQIRRIISLFSELECPDSLKLRVFITSRPELPIQFGFLDINGLYESLELHSISQDIMEHDISIFLYHELGIIRQNFNYVVRSDQRLAEKWPGTVKIRQLVSITQPLFIAAATVCRFLNDATLGSPDELLVRILEYNSRTHMSRLNDIYYSILASQVVNRPRREREDILESFQSIVGAIVTLATPLTVNALSLLLNIPATTIDMKIKVLQSVLEVPKTSEVPVRILHLSFRDYLVDPDLRGATDFWVDQEATHRRLSSRCLSLMSAMLRENICRLPFPGTSPSEVQGLDLHKFIPPELHYACHYWVHHYVSSHNGDCEVHEIYTFLETHLLHWVEAMSVLGHVTDCLTMLHALDAWLEKYSCDNVSDLIKDSLRFIRTHISVIDEAPLQVYSSAIVFSPTNSMVRRLFASRVPKWLPAWPAAEDEWGPCSLVIGHSATVKSAIFSPDSKTIASIYADNTIRILSTKTGKCEHVLAGHSGEIQSIVFSQDSEILASSSTGGTVRIWNLQTGDCDEVLKYPSPTGKAFAFSRDSKVLLTASGNQFVRIWKTQTWDHVILSGHAGAVNSAVISHDSKMLATASDDTTVRLWNTETGRCEKILKGHTGKVNIAAISPDNQMLVSASVDQTLQIWDLNAIKCKKVLRGHDCDVLLAVFSPDSRMIASGDAEGRIGIWNALNGAFMHELKTPSCEGKFESLMFSEDGTKLIAVLSTRTALIHDIKSGNCEQAFDFSSSSSNWSVELSHDLAMILTASSDDNTVRIWDPHTQRKGLKSAESWNIIIFEVKTAPNKRAMVLHIRYIDTNRGSLDPTRSGDVILHGSVIHVVRHPRQKIPLLATRPALRQDHTWITIGNEKFFKLSPECLNAEVSIWEGIVVVDCISGKRIILSFDVGEAGLPSPWKGTEKVQDDFDLYKILMEEGRDLEHFDFY
ncbi:hypothetical protein CEK26_012220 [Fusarium fujikuroi]|nr:hypothetical protein CEK26_012220 [Fusarium fujikuroi]